MGAPGAGKGTQAVRLRERLGVIHVSTGEILRDAVQAGSVLGRKVKQYLASGQLVPDTLIGDLMAERLARPDAEQGFILDGFPRTLAQVEILDGVLEKLGVSLDRVVMLTAPVDEVIRRLSGRRVCPKCNAVYHVEAQPPRSAGVCDACGSALVQRPDDMEQVIRERLAVYERQTLPIAESYGARGVLTSLDGIGDPDEVFERVCRSLGAS